MSSSSMIWSVRLIEPAPGCFVTVRNTAGWALSEALPISGVLEPIEMSAMSLMYYRRVATSDHCLAHFFGISGGEGSLHEVFIAIVIKDSSRCVCVEIFECVYSFGKSDSEMPHLFRAQSYSVFFHFPSHNRHRRHAADGENARADFSVGYRAQFPGEIVSEVKPTISISPRIDDCGPSVGIPAPGGNTDWRAGSFSATACRAAATSVSQSNSTHTTEKPVADELLTRLTPAAPLSDVSTGNVTNCSTSSGAMPGASVMTTTVGAFRSGKCRHLS